MVMRNIVSISISVCLVGMLSAVTITPLRNLLADNPSITYTKVRESTVLDLTPSPLDSNPNFCMPESGILFIPGGIVQSSRGIVRVGDQVIEELLWRYSPLKEQPQKLDEICIMPTRTVAGRVAVIAQEWGNNYYHWLCEILPRLMVLVEQGIEFDYLYVPRIRLPFQEQTLRLFNIPAEKIIQATDDTSIEADELVVPTAVAKTFFVLPDVVGALRDLLLPQRAEHTNFCSKVFVSRRLSSYRRVLNEDAVFALFEQHGFVRYDLEKLSFSEQIALFRGAEVVVSPHGASLTNILFCNPGTKIIELFQQHENMTYAYLSQQLSLDYIGIKTAEFHPKGGYIDTEMPLEIIAHVLRDNPGMIVVC